MGTERAYFPGTYLMPILLRCVWNVYTLYRPGIQRFNRMSPRSSRNRGDGPVAGDGLVKMPWLGL
jgi:hypothetical protein